jgi:hypothetical protein
MIAAKNKHLRIGRAVVLWLRKWKLWKPRERERKQTTTTKTTATSLRGGRVIVDYIQSQAETQKRTEGKRADSPFPLHY